MKIDVLDLPGALMGLGAGKCNYLAMAWRVEMVGEGLAPSTINGRIQMIRSLTKALRMYGRINWACEVANVPAETYRDTSGCGEEGCRRLLASITGDGPADRRDRLAIMLMFGLGLRRVELYRLRVEDIDLERHRLWILGKKRKQREWIAILPQHEDAIRQWLLMRPLGEYLFMSAQGRLSIDWVNRMLRDRGRAVGLSVHPHGLRHDSITAVLDRSGGDVRLAASHARHKNYGVTQLYDDNRRKAAATAAALIA
jgi:integrase/recombinase XerC